MENSRDRLSAPGTEVILNNERVYMGLSRALIGVVVIVSSLSDLARAQGAGKGIGSLEWTRQTGGQLTGGEKLMYVLEGVPPLLGAWAKNVFQRGVAKVNLDEFAPPHTAIVDEAVRMLFAHAHPAMVQHSFRVAYWTLVVMKREKPDLSDRAIEEAWIAALMHDIGMELPPQFGEFTLGGSDAVAELATRFGWDKESERRAKEAITLNPNSRVDRGRFGLLAWAMNVGGFGETSWGPYRSLMHPENIQELEARHPRHGFYEAVPMIVDRELERFQNQRFAVLKAIGFVRRRLKD